MNIPPELKSTKRNFFALISIFPIFLAKAVATFSNLILVLFIGAEINATAVGIFALTQSFMLLIATISRFGTNNSLVKFVRKDASRTSNFQYLLMASVVTLPISILLSVVLIYSSGWLEMTYEVKGLSDAATIIAYGTPAFSISVVFSGYFKGVRKNISAVLSESGLVSFLTIVVLFLLKLIAYEFSVTNVIALFSLSCWFVVLLYLIQIGLPRAWTKVDKSSFKKNATSFFNSSKHFYLHSFTLIAQSSIFVLVVGYYVKDWELGLYRVAQQLSVLISFSLLVVNVIYPAKFAKATYDLTSRSFQDLLSESAFICTVVGVPAFLVCFFFPGYVLGFLGNEFSQAELFLRIFAVGQLINILTGPAGFALGMGSQESLMARISFISSFLGLLICGLFTNWFGVLGGVIAFSGMIAAQNLAMLYFCWSRLRLVSLPFFYRGVK